MNSTQHSQSVTCTYPYVAGKNAVRRKSKKTWQHECQLYQQRKEFWQKNMKLQKEW